jgi:hypothetical protein
MWDECTLILKHSLLKMRIIVCTGQRKRTEFTRSTGDVITECHAASFSSNLSLDSTMRLAFNLPSLEPI